jgi:hypothetical protein
VVRRGRTADRRLRVDQGSRRLRVDQGSRRLRVDHGSRRLRVPVLRRVPGARRRVRTVRADLEIRLGQPDRGSAVVDFALVSGLVVLLFAAVVQVTLAVHVRNTLVDCAAEGARYAALADRTPADGVERARALISASLAPGFADDITAVDTELHGLPVVEVRVSAPLPVAGLVGPGGVLSVAGHAIREPGA